MKLMLLIFLLIPSVTLAADYKSAQRLTAGDVISADVFNDILDRIEITLKEITPAEMVGSWNVEWQTCVNGGPGSCNNLDVGAGWGSDIDDLYKTRTDTWIVAADADGTYSVACKNALLELFQGRISTMLAVLD